MNLGALEILYLANKASQFAFKLADRVNRGDMTKEEALVQWRANATSLELEEARFDELAG